MTKNIPIFPLNLVVYPTELLNLHIFEARYKELILDCEEQDVSFGIPAFIDGKIMSIGTEVKISKIHKIYEDGRMDISTTAINLFRVHEVFEFLPDKLYSGASVEIYPIDYLDDGFQKPEILLKIKVLFTALKIEKSIPLLEEMNAYNIAHLVGMTLEQEYELLQIRDETSRLRYIHDHLDQILPIAKQMETIREKAQMNGHFRELGPLKF